MVEKQSLNLNLQFLENNLNVLREKKAHYFAPSFLEQLENTAFELLEAINQKNNSVVTITQFAPTKISESFIDLCLDSIAGEMRRLSLQADYAGSQTMNELMVIAYDLFCLTVYIRFTLDPTDSSSSQKTFAPSSVADVLEKVSGQEVLN